ncbi:MAG TPA: hypothetical protein VK538_01285 [Solirubrobacteraceae bacterium]|nr:hypothetical protein [Solirubrobacteraceae bacterium]
MCAYPPWRSLYSGGPPEHLGQPQRDVMRMVGRHGGEHRSEDLVVEHMLAVEDVG